MLRRLLGDYPGSIPFHKEALRVAVDTSYPKGKANALGGMGWSIGKMGDLERAGKLFQESININRSIPDNNHNLVVALNNYGSTLVSNGDLNGGEELIQEALELGEESGKDCYTQLTNLGRIAMFKGEFEKAKSLFERTRDRIGSDHVRGEGTTLYYLAKISLLTSDYDMAEELSNKCREIFEKIGDETRAAKVTELQLQIAERSTLNEIVDF